MEFVNIFQKNLLGVMSMAKDNELCVVMKKIVRSNYSNISFYVKTSHVSSVHFDGSLKIFLLKVSYMHRIRGDNHRKRVRKTSQN